MPEGVDEKTWRRAKRAAAEQGKKDNHALVMHIYQRMKGESSEKSLGAGARGLGLTIPSHVAFEHVPGQVPRPPPAARPPPADRAAARLGLRTAAAETPDRPGDIAKGLGLDPETAQRISRAAERAAKAAADEIQFRRDFRLGLTETAQLDRDAVRVVFSRAARWWRKAATAGELPAVNQRLSIARQRGNFPAQSRSGRSGRSAPLMLKAHKLPLRGRQDPVRLTTEPHRALPPGSVRVHRSMSRGGYVRAAKMADGTWKILGKVHPPKGDHKTPHLPDHKEHGDSHPPGKEPHHGHAADHEVHR